LKWRFQALRTGKSFAEVVMLRSLVYRVEQLFLIHRKTGLSLLHVALDPAIAKDSDMMVAGMLSAIQDFVRDSFATGDDSALEEFRVGELQVWIAPGRYAYLAAVIRGHPPRELRSVLEDTIDSIHVLKGSGLANFQGAAASFESLRPELEACLRSQYAAAKRSGGRKVPAWIAVTATAAFLTAALLVALRNELRWRSFVRQLNAQPGIAVTAAHKGWFAPSQITGLRDASASDPAEIARSANIDPAKVQFHWKDFFALDPASVVQRFDKRFAVPSGAQVSSKNGVLALTGSVSYDWLERVRREAKFIPGISALDDSAVAVTYDADSVLQRFNEKFDPPNTVSAAVVRNVLILGGEASQQWLARVRLDALKMPGIKSVDDGKVVNLDERTFQRSKAVIENAFVYFLSDKDDIATEGFAALSRLPDEIRRCETAAKRVGFSVTLEILGYADAVGDEAKNVDLSQRRAHKVADFLSLCGFESTVLKPIGLGPAVKPTEVNKVVPELAQRRVSFKVIAQPATAAR
jgi:outer membrane protein OmpA-like peptidoglycan-associated protein